MPESVRQRAPEMYPFMFSAYEEPPPSSAGIQCYHHRKGYNKGTSGASSFLPTIYPLIQQLTSEFKLFYLDDGIVGGCLSDILRD